MVLKNAPQETLEPSASFCPWTNTFVTTGGMECFLSDQVQGYSDITALYSHEVFPKNTSSLTRKTQVDFKWENPV